MLGPMKNAVRIVLAACALFLLVAVAGWGFLAS